MKQKSLVQDGLLWAFLVPMIAALTITAHGTWIFYSYILPPALAVSATVVLAVGVPLLLFAATLHPAYRAYYVAGMVILLFLEGAAQYFQGQAGFVSRIVANFPDSQGVDLVALASAPAGRILPILYLAALTIVVVGFGEGAAIRVRDLRAARVVVATEQTTIKELRESIAKAAADFASANQRADEQRAAAANYQAKAVEFQQQLDEQRATAVRECADLARQLRAAQQQAANRPPTKAAVLAWVANRQRDGATLNQLAAELGFPEATLRTWVANAPVATANGHAIEEVQQ